MMRFAWLMAAWCTVAFAHARESSSVFHMPAKPARQVSDDSGWLTRHERLHWENRLSDWKSAHGVDIHLVILPDLYDTPPGYVAEQIATHWGERALHGVVLHVPSGDGPYLWWDGEIIKSIQLDPHARREMISRMEKRSRSQIAEREQVFYAMEEMSDTLRVIRAQHAQMLKLRDKWNEKAFQHWSSNRLSRRTKIIIACTAALTALLTLIALIRYLRKRGKTYQFPRVSAQRRFGAAHAGGSGATINL
jgi:hypothetical protein